MNHQAWRLGTVALCCLPCFLFPIAIATLAQIYGPESDPGMDAPWSLHAIDSLFWTDVVFTALFVWMMQGWRWLAAVVSIPSLCVTAVLDIFGGMWVSGNYF
jgi:hypothetical protein